jgi:hypothetical protein
VKLYRKDLRYKPHAAAYNDEVKQWHIIKKFFFKAEYGVPLLRMVKKANSQSMALHLFDNMLKVRQYCHS